ncbi:MAG: hypothetical protein JXR13_18225 [Thalassovita sp.]
MAFRGQIQDVLPMRQGSGLVLMLTNIEGALAKGMQVQLLDQETKITELGRNSTDGKPVSTRSCLTGKPCAPYGAIALDWQGPQPAAQTLVGQWVQQVTAP